MFTVFDLIQLVALIAGLIIGATHGYRSFGWLGAIVGAAGGVVVGFVVGRLPWILAWLWMRTDLKRTSTQTLRDRAESQYFVTHLIIAELVTRGEPLESFRDLVATQLQSDSPDVRRFGQTSARIWFPDLLPADPNTQLQDPAISHDSGR